MLVNPTLRHQPAPSDFKENRMITFGEGISRLYPSLLENSKGKSQQQHMKVPNYLLMDLWIKLQFLTVGKSRKILLILPQVFVFPLPNPPP